MTKTIAEQLASIRSINGATDRPFKEESAPSTHKQRNYIRVLARSMDRQDVLDDLEHDVSMEEAGELIQELLIERKTLLGY